MSTEPDRSIENQLSQQQNFDIGSIWRYWIILVDFGVGFLTLAKHIFKKQNQGQQLLQNTSTSWVEKCQIYGSTIVEVQ